MSKQTEQEPEPQTKREWALCRCRLSCKIGRDSLSGISKPPKGYTSTEYTLYNLLYAVEELAIALGEKE